MFSGAGFPAGSKHMSNCYLRRHPILIYYLILPGLDPSLTYHVLSIQYSLTNTTNEFIFQGWFFVRMSNETQIVFRPDVLIDIFFWGARFCLVDVSRFHVPHLSVAKDHFSIFTAPTISCIRAGSLWGCSAKFNYCSGLTLLLIVSFRECASA